MFGFLLIFLSTNNGIQMKVLSAGSGYLLGELKVEEMHVSPLKLMHGGFVATLIDSTTAIALCTHEKVDWRKNASICLNTVHIRPSRIGDVIRIEVKTVNVGKTFANVEAALTDSISGKLLATGTMTRYLLPTNEDPNDLML